MLRIKAIPEGGVMRQKRGEGDVGEGATPYFLTRYPMTNMRPLFSRWTLCIKWLAFKSSESSQYVIFCEKYEHGNFRYYEHGNFRSHLKVDETRERRVTEKVLLESTKLLF